MKGIIVLCCVLLGRALSVPIESNHVENYEIELRTDNQMLDEMRHAELIVGGEKINLDGNSNNDQLAKIGLLSGFLQRLPTTAPASSTGGVNYVFYSPLSALIQKLRPTTTTTAATTTSTSTESTTTTTTTPTTTTTTTPSTTTPTTTTTTTTPSTTTSTTTTTTTTTTPTP